MCFLIDKNNPEELIAEEDIECVKRYTAGTEGRLYSPFYIHIAELGKTYTERRFGERHPEHNIDTIDYGFHSYHDAESARIIDYIGGNGVYVMCTIPKGTRYYRNGTEHEYVSQSIRLDRIID